MRRFLLFLTVLLTALIVEAVGPKVPHLLYWTPSPSPDVTGYCRGDYLVAMSATNSYGESDLSIPDFLWHYKNPVKPADVTVTP